MFENTYQVFAFSLALVVGLYTTGISEAKAPKPKLIVSSDGSAIVDSPIRFSVQILNPDHDLFRVNWVDPFRRLDYSEEMTAANNFTSKWNLTYHTSDQFLGTTTVTVNIFYKYFIIWNFYKNEQIFFNVTQNFTGAIDVWQGQGQITSDPVLVATKNETKLIANFHDPSNYLHNATNVTYIWMNKAGVIPNITGNSLIQNFTTDGDYYYNVTLSAVYNGTTNSSAVTKSGFLELNVTAKAAVSNLTVAGQLWFPHGKLLDLNVTCDGSPPFTYCWYIHTGAYNQTGYESCNESSTDPVTTNVCDFQISNYYLSQANGTFTLFIVVTNDVSKSMNQSMIHVYLVHQKQPLSIILVPVTCSLLAIILVIFGIAYYMEHQNRYSVEVANFDFGDDSELPYTSFMERLKGVMTSRPSSSSLQVPIIQDGESTSDDPWDAD